MTIVFWISLYIIMGTVNAIWLLKKPEIREKYEESVDSENFNPLPKFARETWHGMLLVLIWPVLVSAYIEGALL